MNQHKFLRAWNYLNSLECVHHNGINMMDKCLNVKVIKINPYTKQIDRIKGLNTLVQICLEFGELIYNEITNSIEVIYDPNLDCSADNFEQAVIELARLVRKKYNHNYY